MNPPRILAAVAATLAFTTAAPAGAETVQGSGTSATEARNVSGFRGVGLSVPGRLEIVQGDSEKLSVTADDNVLPLIETVVENGQLKIRYKDHRNVNVRTKTPIRMTLNAKTLEAIGVAGSGDVQAPALNSREMKVSIAGSGDVTLGGKSTVLDVSISGSGDVKAAKFESQEVKVSIAGSGDATIWARDTLKVSIAGSGDVRYYGDAKVQNSVAGSGRVRRLGATPG